MFGKPVGLTIQGGGGFKTLRGGFVSFALQIYVYYLFITLLIPVFLGVI